MQRFRSRPAPPSTPVEVRRYLDTLGLDIQRAAQEPDDNLPLLTLYSAPSNPPSGLFYADGTSWNPGSGAGLYYYDSNAQTYTKVGSSTDNIPLSYLSTAPTSPVDGLYLADGSGWNPGSGRGLYRYDATSGFVAVGGSSSASYTSITGFFPGTASTVSTGLRIYPGFNKNLQTLFAWVSSAVSANAVVQLYKNGIAWTSVTITTGNSSATASSLALAITSTDYITASLTATGAVNCGFRMDFA